MGGLAGFYRGMLVSTALQLPSNAVYICVYQASKELIEDYCGSCLGAVRQGSPAAPVLAALFSETVCVLFEVPHDVITQKVQIEEITRPLVSVPTPRDASSSSSWRIARQIVKEEGVAGLYSGLSAHLLTYLPWSTTWWATYELGKVLLGRFLDSGAASVASSFVAGVLAAAVSNPLHVVKTRMQCDTSMGQQGLTGTFRAVVAQEGPASLFKGVAVAVAFDVLVSLWGGLRYGCVMWIARKRLD